MNTTTKSASLVTDILFPKREVMYDVPLIRRSGITRNGKHDKKSEIWVNKEQKENQNDNSRNANMGA